MTALMSIKNQTPASTVSFLDMKARRINELSENWTENSIDIGKELAQAKSRFTLQPTARSNASAGSKHGLSMTNDSGASWASWLKKNTSWEQRQADSFIQIARKFGTRGNVRLVGFKVFQYLARETVPDEAADEIISRAEKGEKIGWSKAKEIVATHLPTRAQAIKEARDSGKLVTARDGKMYSGASEDEMAAYSERRSAVFGIERAFNTIADCEWSPTQLMSLAEDHWLAEMSIGKLEAAIKFLTKLQPLLEKRQKVVS